MRLFGGAAAPGSFDYKFNEEAKTRRISPAAGIYLRGFGVLPSMITATGPKGHITKQDIWLYVDKNNVQKRVIETAPLVVEQVATPTASEPPKK